MFTFTLAFLLAINIFLFISTSLGFCGKKKEFGRKHSRQKPLTTVSGIECQIDRFAAHFSSSPKKNAFQSLEENL